MEWLKRLRMDSLKKVAFRIVLFFALAVGVFVYFHCWELFGMLSPKTLADLTPETMEGAYVEDDIYLFYTPYLEELYGENRYNAETTGIQYLVDFDEELFMGLSVHKDRLDEANAMMDACEKYFDGKLPEEDIPVLHVKGSIRAMDSEEKGYYMDLAEGDAELESIMLPYYLDVNRIDGRPVAAQICIFIGSIILLILGIFPLVKALTGGYQKQVKAKLSAMGDFESEAERAARFYDLTEPVSGVRMGSEYVYFVHNADSILLRPWDVVWAYQSTTQHRTNGIPSGKTYAAILRTMDGKQYTLSMKEEQVQRLLEAISVSLPGVVIGYTEDLERVYKQDRSAFSDRWEEERPGCTSKS